MVEKPYYQAKTTSNAHKPRYQKVADAINQLGRRRADRIESKYGHGPDERGHFEIEVGSWANGPQLRLEYFNSDGESDHPTIDKRLTEVVIQQGYVPTSFRPEETSTAAGPREHTGRWLWYCRPVEDICDGGSQIYDTAFALQRDDGTFVRTAEKQDIVTFESREKATAVCHGELEVVEVND